MRQDRRKRLVRYLVIAFMILIILGLIFGSYITLF